MVQGLRGERPPSSSSVFSSPLAAKGTSRSQPGRLFHCSAFLCLVRLLRKDIGLTAQIECIAKSEELGVHRSPSASTISCCLGTLTPAATW